jgi:hypothetical protein
MAGSVDDFAVIEIQLHFCKQGAGHLRGALAMDVRGATPVYHQCVYCECSPQSLNAFTACRPSGEESPELRLIFLLFTAQMPRNGLHSAQPIVLSWMPVGDYRPHLLPRYEVLQ